MDEPYGPEDRALHLQRLMEIEERRRMARQETDAGRPKTGGKSIFIFYRDSPTAGRWVEGSEAGMERAMKAGRPVRRSLRMPRTVPELMPYEKIGV